MIVSYRGKDYRVQILQKYPPKLDIGTFEYDMSDEFCRSIQLQMVRKYFEDNFIEFRYITETHVRDYFFNGGMVSGIDSIMDNVRSWHDEPSDKILKPTIELRGKRTRKSKTFRLGNGKLRIEIGGEHSHYQDEIGRWQNVDLTHEGTPRNISPNPHGRHFNHFIPKCGKPVEVDDFTGAMRMYFEDNIYVDLGGNSNLQGEYENNGKPKVKRNFPNFDIEYTVNDQGIKRWWRLKKQPTTPEAHIREFRSPVSFVGCYYDNGDIKHSETNEILARLTQPFVYEVDGDIVKEATMTIVDGTMTVSVDTTGMTYPVIIDPTLSLTAPDDDAMISSAANADKNYGGLAFVDIRSFNAGNVNRGLVRFDFSAVPAGSTIDSAELAVFVYSSSSGTGRTWEANRLTQLSWVEGTASGTVQAGSCSWNSYAHPTAWGTAGGDYTTTGQVTAVVPSIPNWITWTPTAQVQYMLDNDSGIANFLIKDADETANPAKSARWYSNEDADSRKAKLTITYTEVQNDDLAIGNPITAPIFGPIKQPTRQ